MSDRLPAASLDQIFLKARTYKSFAPDPIPAALLREMYETARTGPTAANANPGRFLFLVSAEAKAQLSPFMSETNRPQALAAPVNIIMAYDIAFYETLPKLFPHNPDARNWYSAPDVAQENAFRSGTLQAAYLMLVARSLGLDCGPMGGFDAKGVNEAFFSGTSWRANFICNLGYGTPDKLRERGPRLDFEEACKLL